MIIKLKDESINLSGLNYKMIQALDKACFIWRKAGCLVLTITAGLDGKHGPNSKHYTGCALDIRSRDLPDSIGMANELRDSLSEDYDVVLETDHIHVEFDPKN